MSGAAAKKGYRYQDLCAMYFALEGVRKDPSFQYLYCEQEKHDFEIWGDTSFSGYQTKTNPSTLTANETREVFAFYLKRSTASGKTINKLRFVFTEQPKNSLSHLFSFAKSGGRGVQYTGHVKKYIDRALAGIPIESLPVDFYHYEYEQIHRMVFSLCEEILRERVGASPLPTEAVHTFVSKLRDKVDEIGCDPDGSKRRYALVEFSSLIDQFLAGAKFQRQDGRRVIEISLPEELAERVIEAKITVRPERKGSNDGGEVDENL